MPGAQDQDREQRIRGIAKQGIQSGQELQAITQAQNEISGIQGELQNNLAMERANAAARQKQNQMMQQAANMMMADQGVARQVQGMNQNTQALMQKYGIKPGQQQNRNSSNSTTRQSGSTYNSRVENITTTKNEIHITQPQIPMQQPNIPMKNNGENVKAWISNMIAQQQNEAEVQKKEFRQREWSLNRAANKMMARIESASKSFAEKMDPRYQNSTVQGQFGGLLFGFAGFLLSKYWAPLLKKIDEWEKAFKTIFGWDKNAKEGGEGTFLGNIKKFLGVKEGEGMLGGFLTMVKEQFQNLGDTFAEFFEDRGIAIKQALDLSDKEWGENSGGGIFSFLTDSIGKQLGIVMRGATNVIGNVLKAAIGGTAALGSIKMAKTQKGIVDTVTQAGDSLRYNTENDYDMFGGIKNNQDATWRTSMGVGTNVMQAAKSGVIRMGQLGNTLGNLYKLTEGGGTVLVGEDFLLALVGRGGINEMVSKGLATLKRVPIEDTVSLLGEMYDKFSLKDATVAAVTGGAGAAIKGVQVAKKGYGMAKAGFNASKGIINSTKQGYRVAKNAANVVGNATNLGVKTANLGYADDVLDLASQMGGLPTYLGGTALRGAISYATNKEMHISKNGSGKMVNAYEVGRRGMQYIAKKMGSPEFNMESAEFWAAMKNFLVGKARAAGRGGSLTFDVDPEFDKKVAEMANEKGSGFSFFGRLKAGALGEGNLAGKYEHAQLANNSWVSAASYAGEVIGDAMNSAGAFIQSKLPIPTGTKNGTEAQKKFIELMRPLIVDALRRKGYDTNFTDIILTQLGIESGWGTSGLAQYNNFGGIRYWGGDSQKGLGKVRMRNRSTGQDFDWATFATPEAFLDWHIDYLNRKYHVFNDTPDNYVRNIIKGGYCNDPGYDTALINTYGNVRRIENGMGLTPLENLKDIGYAAGNAVSNGLSSAGTALSEGSKEARANAEARIQAIQSGSGSAGGSGGGGSSSASASTPSGGGVAKPGTSMGQWALMRQGLPNTLDEAMALPKEQREEFFSHQSKGGDLGWEVDPTTKKISYAALDKKVQDEKNYQKRMRSEADFDTYSSGTGISEKARDELDLMWKGFLSCRGKSFKEIWNQCRVHPGLITYRKKYWPNLTPYSLAIGIKHLIASTKDWKEIYQKLKKSPKSLITKYTAGSVFANLLADILKAVRWGETATIAQEARKAGVRVAVRDQGKTSGVVAITDPGEIIKYKAYRANYPVEALEEYTKYFYRGMTVRQVVDAAAGAMDTNKRIKQGLGTKADNANRLFRKVTAGKDKNKYTYDSVMWDDDIYSAMRDGSLSASLTSSSSYTADMKQRYDTLIAKTAINQEKQAQDEAKAAAQDRKEQMELEKAKLATSVAVGTATENVQEQIRVGDEAIYNQLVRIGDTLEGKSEEKAAANNNAGGGASPASPPAAPPPRKYPEMGQDFWGRQAGYGM